MKDPSREIETAINDHFEHHETSFRRTHSIGAMPKPEGEEMALLISMKEFYLGGLESDLEEMKSILLEYTFKTIFGPHSKQKYPNSTIVWRARPECETMEDWLTKKKIARIYYRFGWHIPSVSSSI